MDSLSFPSPVVIIHQLQQLDKALLETDSPVVAGPLLLKRDKLIRIAVIVYLYGSITSPELEEIIQSDMQAKQHLEELQNALLGPQEGESPGLGQMALPREGILGGFNSIDRGLLGPDNS